MDAKLEQPRTAATTAVERTASRNAERRILCYWLIVTILGLIFLWDWIVAWNLPLTLSNWPLTLYLLLTFALSQLLYAIVARYDGRPFHASATAIFALGNGIAETLAFALVYRFGELLFGGFVGLFAPDAANIAGFLGGVALFIVYGGLIHALFWLRVLPPHLSDTPRAKAIRRWRPLAEIALVIGWSLCFWLYRDIWTVVLFHILIDVGLMLKVRPPLFGARLEA